MLVCAVLTYGGVSLFVVVFAVYPFAAEMFRQGDIPKRLIPGTIALGAFTFTMDSLPGTPQIQNIIPTTFFKHHRLGRAAGSACIGALFISVVRHRLSELAHPQGRRAPGEGYGDRPLPTNRSRRKTTSWPIPRSRSCRWCVVGVLNKLFTLRDPDAGTAPRNEVTLAGLDHPIVTDVPPLAAIWAVEARAGRRHPDRARSWPGAWSAAGSPRHQAPRSPARCWPR